MIADFRNVKKVYYNGSYHDSVRFENELIWETEKEMEGILRRSEVDLTGLTEVDVKEVQGEFDAGNDDYGSYFLLSTTRVQTVGGIKIGYPYKEAFKFISINDWFIEVDSEEVQMWGRGGISFKKHYPPSYLERLFGLPFPYGTLYDEIKLTEHNKISLWIREEV